MEPTINIAFIFNLIVSLIVSLGSFWYFKVVKSKYRWIKLFWGLAMLVYTVILIYSMFTQEPHGYLQHVALLLPTTCLLYGLIVSFARKKDMETLARLEEELNGEMTRWIEEQLATRRDK